MLNCCSGPGKHKRSRDFCYEEMRPTFTHEVLYKLLDLGYLKHIISQNTDGIHRLSGVPRDRISELHGNSFHEKCEKCGARLERPFAVRRCVGGKVPPRICVHCHFDHRTGRLCERKVKASGTLHAYQFDKIFFPNLSAFINKSLLLHCSIV